MTVYRVRWDITILDAESADDAAKKAAILFVRNENTHVFKVQPDYYSNDMSEAETINLTPNPKWSIPI